MTDLSLLTAFLHEYIINEDQLQLVYTRFLNQVTKGLTKEGHADADTKCYLTYIQDLPTGDEQGKYFALDLGGSNFRVLLVHLKGDRDAEMINKVYPLSAAHLSGSAKQLFDYIAKCLGDFTTEFKIDDENIPLGFTFSFPCIQTGLTKAILVRWTKGYTATGVVNEDVGRLLMEAIMRLNLKSKINVLGILNDTTGTLMSCAHRNPDCRVGLIVGTGCNVCYVERVENCERLADEFKGKPYMLVNVEWGAFGEHGDIEFLRTDIDRYVDEHSTNKGTQLFEKLLAGMYLGNLVRLVLKQAVRENLIFNECCSLANKMMNVLTNKVDCIETRHISDVEGDQGPDYPVTRRVLKEVFNLDMVTLQDIDKFRFICETISKRSGHLVGVGVSVLLNKMAFEKVTVGVDGTVFRCHPKYPGYMRTMLDRFVDKSVKYDLMLSEDGSGRGAALVAAVASKAIGGK